MVVRLQRQIQALTDEDGVSERPCIVVPSPEPWHHAFARNQQDGSPRHRLHPEIHGVFPFEPTSSPEQLGADRSLQSLDRTFRSLPRH